MTIPGQINKLGRYSCTSSTSMTSLSSSSFCSYWPTRIEGFYQFENMRCVTSNTNTYWRLNNTFWIKHEVYSSLIQIQIRLPLPRWCLRSGCEFRFPVLVFHGGVFLFVFGIASFSLWFMALQSGRWEEKRKEGHFCPFPCHFVNFMTWQWLSWSRDEFLTD